MSDELKRAPVAVKGLTWVERGDKHFSGRWVITRHGPENFHVSLSTDECDMPSLVVRKYLDGAKSYVQNCHNSRILSALSDTPTADIRAETDAEKMIHAQVFSAGYEAGERDGRKIALDEAARTAAIHSQYPATTQYDKGYGQSAIDAAAKIRALKTQGNQAHFCTNYSPDIQAMGDCRNCGNTYQAHQAPTEETGQ